MSRFEIIHGTVLVRGKRVPAKMRIVTNDVGESYRQVVRGTQTGRVAFCGNKVALSFVTDDSSTLEKLRETSTLGLLTAAYSLTHRIHVAEREAKNREHATDLRAQREFINAEIIRRTGDAT